MREKILLLYATAGSGHKKAAEAMKSSLLNNGYLVEMVDILDYTSKVVKFLYSEGYIYLMIHFRWLWGILFFLSHTPLLYPLNVAFRRFINARLFSAFTENLIFKNPKTVVSTHFLASELVSYAKQKYGVTSKLITVITDFGVHNFWISPMTDFYCCATESTKKILRLKSIPVEKIKVTGIPLDEKFLRKLDVNYLRGSFMLEKDKLTVLIVTGGTGAGPIEKIVDLLKDDFQILVVCGNNAHLYTLLLEKKYPNVRLFGFIDYMHELLEVSDVIITKAGGLTITEALNKKLAIIFFFLVPGQELINARTLAGLKAGIIAETPAEIKDLVDKLKKSPETLTELKDKAASLARPHSCEEIIKLI